MTARPPKETLGLDMPFAEAMERFIGVDPKEMHANIAKSKKKKPPGGRKPPPGSKEKAKNVISLKATRTALRKRGRV